MSKYVLDRGAPIYREAMDAFVGRDPAGLWDYWPEGEIRTSQPDPVRAVFRVRAADATSVMTAIRPQQGRITVIDFGTVVEHRRHPQFSDTPACWDGREDAPVVAGPTAEPEVRCRDERCFGDEPDADFDWWAASCVA